MTDARLRVLVEQCDEAICRLALEEGLVSPERHAETVLERERTGRPLREILLARGWLDGSQIDGLVARWAGLELAGRAAVPRPSPGRKISDFDLVARLSESGAAQVWKAWDLRVERWVAIKLLRPRGADEIPSARARTETLAAGRLQHPNIVPIFHVGEDQGWTYIVMPYIEGVTLRRAGLPLEEVIRAIKECALAVEHAHSRGVIHRDLKPDNLMIDLGGKVWILDFGLAFLKDIGRSPTLAGTVMGTPAYMSPEQARGMECARDGSTDVYSLGATLYDLATGHPPFSAKSVAEIARKICDEDPIPPRRRNPKISRDLGTVILKAMEKDPRNRYSHALDLAEDLARLESGSPIRARPAGPVRRLLRGVRRRPWTLTALTLAACALAVWGVESRGRERAREEALGVLSRMAAQSVESILSARRKGERVPNAMREVLVRLYLEATAMAPDSAEPHFLMGRLERSRMRDDSAMDYQKLALHREPHHGPALDEWIVLLSRRHARERTPELRRSLEEAVQAAGASRDRNEVALALAACELGHPDARGKLIDAVRRNPACEGFEALARMSADPDEQERWCTEGLGHDQGYVPCWIVRGAARMARDRASFESGGDPSLDYLGDLQRATELDPKNSEAWWRRGQGMSLQADWQRRRQGPQAGMATWVKADLYYTRALNFCPPAGKFNRFPQYVDSLESRARTKSEMGLVKKKFQDPYGLACFRAAESDYTSLIAVDPRAEYLTLRAEVRTHLVELLGMSGKDPTESFTGCISDYDQASNRLGGETRILTGRGRARLLMARYWKSRGNQARASKEYDAARAELERALELDAAAEVRPLLDEARRNGSSSH
jgi:tetratricopeptide (TPR) repeat protein